MFDLTGIATSILAIAFSVATAFVPKLVGLVKDQQAATVLGAAVNNSLGAIQQAATGAIVHYLPRMEIPGVPAPVAVGVQYVLEHAGDEAKALGISQEAIAAKITAKLGLAAIVTNQAIAASPSLATPLPTAPLSPMSQLPVAANAAR